MQEKQVTIGDQTFRLEEASWSWPPQNPIEQEGTYPFAGSASGPFHVKKLKIVYPTREEERQILDRMARTTNLPAVGPVVEVKDVLAARQVINDIYLDDKVKGYIVDLVCATREPEKAAYRCQGVHSTGGFAASDHRPDPGRQSLRLLARPRLRHAPGCQKHWHGCPARVAITYEAEAEERNQRDGDSKDLTSCRCRELHIRQGDHDCRQAAQVVYHGACCPPHWHPLPSRIGSTADSFMADLW